MLRFAITDDNAEMMEIVQQAIHKWIEVPVITTQYNNAQILLFDVQDGKCFDVYILDVEMEKINGLDLARKIRKIHEHACIIFLTSHAEFALASYDLKIQAYQYILKGKMRQQLPDILKDVVKKIDQKKYYTIQNTVRFERVDCSEVYYIYRDGKNSVIVTPTREYRERKTLEKMVADMHMSELILIERGCVANILHIRHIRNNVVEMENGQELFISRKNIHRVKEEVNRYWSENL